jgi:hypothetical protein
MEIPFLAIGELVKQQAQEQSDFWDFQSIPTFQLAEDQSEPRFAEPGQRFRFHVQPATVV